MLQEAHSHRFEPHLSFLSSLCTYVRTYLLVTLAFFLFTYTTEVLQPKIAEPGSEYYIAQVESKFQVCACVCVCVCVRVCMCVRVCVHMYCVWWLKYSAPLMQPVIPFKDSAESMQLHRTFCEVGPLSSCVVCVV